LSFAFFPQVVAAMQTTLGAAVVVSRVDYAQMSWKEQVRCLIVFLFAQLLQFRLIVHRQ
jgi:hypothetical protein